MRIRIDMFMAELSGEHRDPNRIVEELAKRLEFKVIGVVYLNHEYPLFYITEPANKNFPTYVEIEDEKNVH